MGCGTSQQTTVPGALPQVSVQATFVGASGNDAKHAAVILPGGYTKLMQPNEKYHYHILAQDTYSMGQPLKFNVDSFVESAIQYCKKHKIQGVFGFDCFPSLIASIISTSLGLQGPSFRSVFHCISKYYMRKELSPEVPMTKLEPLSSPAPPKSFPVVVKEIDCQFYIGTWIIYSVEQWEQTMKHLQQRNQAELDARKKFYFKWFQKLHPNDMPESRWEDYVLYHVEPFFEGREQQIEIVLEQDNHLLVADTGDIIKENGIITMFVTPGSFDIPTTWAHNITKKLHAMGYKNQAIDLEFISTQDGPQVVEINSRYSYMGFASWYSDHSEKGALLSKPDLRNLENRTCSCLGQPCPRFPSDENIISKLAVAVYTNKGGPVEDIVDLEFLKKYLAEGHAECWTPKPAFKAGNVGPEEFTYGGGKWAKLGFMMLTAKRVEWAETNAKLKAMFEKLFKHPGSYLLAQDDEIGHEVDKHALDY